MQPLSGSMVDGVTGGNHVAGHDAGAPPLPPVAFRRLVCHDDSAFNLPHPGTLIFPLVPPELYRSVFDFGCGCGRIARQLLVQEPRPLRYDGIDIHRGMVEWCQSNLSVLDPSFRFSHHDVWNVGLAPDNTRQSTAPFPVPPGEYSLVVAHSVFTHLYKDQTEFYLAEIARILTDDGLARTTWFLFDRSTFPMLMDFQVCLFVNECDPTNAVIYDWTWLTKRFQETGLSVVHTIPPTIRGYQWEIYLAKSNGAGNGLFAGFPTNAFSMASMCGTGFEARVSNQSKESCVKNVLRYTGSLGPREFAARQKEIPLWDHSFCFDNGFSVPGAFDVGADLEAYKLPAAMRGLRVLVIENGASWLAFYCEQQGAEVFCINALAEVNKTITDRGGQVKLMKEILGSRIELPDLDVYELTTAAFGEKKFDLVFVGPVLCSLRDPIGALAAVRGVCRHRVIASIDLVPGQSERESVPCQYMSFASGEIHWQPNEACFKQWFAAAGWVGVEVGASFTLRPSNLRAPAGGPVPGDKVLSVGSAFVP